MAFCHIYARRDGTFTVRMHGTVSRSAHGLVLVGKDPFIGGTVQYTSQPVATEQQARDWIELGRQRDGLTDMPEPRVIRRGKSTTAHSAAARRPTRPRSRQLNLSEPDVALRK